MTPELALFRAVYELAISIMGADNVYDEVPDAEEKYPFIFIREVINDDESNSDLMGMVRMSLDVYGTRYDINVLDEVKVALNNGFIRLDEAYGYNIRLMNQSMTTRPENTDRQSLKRVLVSVDFQYTKKER